MATVEATEDNVNSLIEDNDMVCGLLGALVRSLPQFRTDLRGGL